MKKLLFSVLIALVFGCDEKSGNPGPLPGISINDVSMPEGNTPNTIFEFEVSLSQAYPKPVVFHYSTADGTAKSGEDFTAVQHQEVTFQANETKKKIQVTVTGDDLKENDEQFTVALSNVTGANVVRQTGTGEIRNDDTRILINNTGYDAPAQYAGYALTWRDEFDGNTADPATWSFESGDGCPNLCGWGNNELQYYTNSTENLFFQDGKMVIQAKKETYGGKNYTSARIKTQAKKPGKFGRIDIRAILPTGKGIWPAFWLLPQSNVYGTWPRSGELDLMEMVGHEPNKVHGTLHYGPGPGSTQISRSYTLPSGTFHDQFHVFSIEWTQDQIKWYVDGNLFSTVNKADFGSVNYPFNEEFYLIINLAVGGNWPGSPDANTSFPQYLIVDYVRWYQ